MDSNGSKYVSPYELLHEDSSGIRSNFLEQLKLQHISESIIFERHVIDCVDQAVISFGATNKSNVGEEATGDITIGKLREALCLADPNKPRPEINQLLARGYGLSVETVLIYEARRTLVSSEEFKRCIHSILLKKSPATTKATL